MWLYWLVQLHKVCLISFNSFRPTSQLLSFLRSLDEWKIIRSITALTWLFEDIVGRLVCLYFFIGVSHARLLHCLRFNSIGEFDLLPLLRCTDFQPLISCFFLPPPPSFPSSTRLFSVYLSVATRRVDFSFTTYRWTQSIGQWVHSTSCNGGYFGLHKPITITELLLST